MKNTKRLLAVILATLMTAAAVTGCGNSGDGTAQSKGEASTADKKADKKDGEKKVEVRLLSGWTTGGEDVSPDSVLYNKMIEDFNAGDNGVKIINEPSAGDDKRNKARLDVTANNACDIWHFWGGSILQDYVNEGVLGDVDEYLKESTKLKKEDIPEAYWKMNIFNDKTYGVPFTLATSVFMINKEIFEQNGLTAPKTVEELKAVSKTLVDKGITPLNVGSKGGNPSHFLFSDYVMQYKGGQEGTEAMLQSYKFNTPQNLKGLEICEDLVKAGVFPKDTMANGDWSPSFELFTQGKAAMCYTFNWMFTQLPEEMLDKVEIIGVPKAADAEIDPQTFQEGWINDSNVITQKALDSDRREAVIKAFDFINYDISKAGSEAAAMVSPNDKITATIDYTDPSMGLLGKVMQWRVEKKIEGRPNHWANCPNGDLQAYYQSTLDELWAGSITAQEAMDKIQKKFDEEKANAGA